MTINEIVKEIHENAKDHGWWDEERSFGEIIALCHSELSEALEEYRNNMPEIYFPCNAGGLCEKDSCASKIYNANDSDSCSAQSKKPEGTAVELVDCVIRIFDYLGKTGVDVERILLEKHNYNKSRPYRHGGKII